MNSDASSSPSAAQQAGYGSDILALGQLAIQIAGTRGPGRMAQRAAQQIAYRTYRLFQQQGALASKQYAEELARAYPTSPQYSPLVPVTFTELPVKYTSKVTALQQRLMQPGLTLKQQQHIGARIAKFERKEARYVAAHPTVVSTRLANLKQ